MIRTLDKIPGAPHFSIHEVTWLPQFQMHALPESEVIWNNIQRTAMVMEEIRGIFGSQIFVTSWLRPKYYDAYIKTDWKHPQSFDNFKAKALSTRSAHVDGLAVDFRVDRFSCDEVRAKLEGMLDDLRIRMERNPGSSWVHIDLRQPGPSGRYFIP